MKIAKTKPKINNNNLPLLLMLLNMIWKMSSTGNWKI